MEVSGQSIAKTVQQWQSAFKDFVAEAGNDRVQSVVEVEAGLSTVVVWSLLIPPERRCTPSVSSVASDSAALQFAGDAATAFSLDQLPRAGLVDEGCAFFLFDKPFFVLCV